MSRCKIKTINSTYESAVRRELDGGLVCEAAEDHVFLKQRQTISTDLFIRGVISKKTNKQTNKQTKNTEALHDIGLHSGHCKNGKQSLIRSIRHSNNSTKRAFFYLFFLYHEPCNSIMHAERQKHAWICSIYLFIPSFSTSADPIYSCGDWPRRRETSSGNCQYITEFYSKSCSIFHPLTFPSSKTDPGINSSQFSLMDHRDIRFEWATKSNNFGEHLVLHQVILWFMIHN